METCLKCAEQRQPFVWSVWGIRNQPGCTALHLCALQGSLSHPQTGRMGDFRGAQLAALTNVKAEMLFQLQAFGKLGKMARGKKCRGLEYPKVLDEDGACRNWGSKRSVHLVCLFLWSYMWNMSTFFPVSYMSSVGKELGSSLAIVPVQGNTDSNEAGNTAALLLDFFNTQEEINLVWAFPKLSGQPGWEFLWALSRVPGSKLPKVAEQLSNLTVLFTARLPGTQPN